MISTVILGPDGKPAQKDLHTSCPQCGSGPERRIPSSGFGTPYFICFCGYEFKELLCPSVT